MCPALCLYLFCGAGTGTGVARACVVPVSHTHGPAQCTTQAPCTTFCYTCGTCRGLLPEGVKLPKAKNFLESLPMLLSPSWCESIFLWIEKVCDIINWTGGRKRFSPLADGTCDPYPKSRNFKGAEIRVRHFSDCESRPGLRN